jgi:hypothetical protein
MCCLCAFGVFITIDTRINTYTHIHTHTVLEHVAGGELFDYIVAKGRLPGVCVCVCRCV